MMDNLEKQKILQEMGGIPEDFYNGLVRNLITQVHEQISKSKQALSNDDYDSISQSAHFIKGASGNLRIYSVYEITKSIELASTQKGTKYEIASGLKKLEDAVADLERDF